MALRQAAPHIDWSTGDEEEKRLCGVCHGMGIMQISPTVFGACTACLSSDVKVGIVRIAEHSSDSTPARSLVEYLKRVPVTLLSERDRAVLLERNSWQEHGDDQDLDLEVWAAVRGDGTMSQGGSPVEAYLGVERECDERDSILGLVARQADAMKEEIRAEVIQLVASKLRQAR